MTTLELLFALEAAGFDGLWRDGDRILFTSFPGRKGEFPQELWSEVKRQESRLLPMLKTVQQAGLTVEEPA